MKNFILSMITLMSFSAMAEDLNTALNRVEKNNNAVCSEISRTGEKCINTVCVYSVKVFCTSNATDFTAKVKMIEYTGLSGEKVVKARKVKILR